MGVESGDSVKMVAFVKCAGTCDKAGIKANYYGIADCKRAAAIPGRGDKACSFGCLGFGSCVAACQFDAIHVENGIAVVKKMEETDCDFLYADGIFVNEQNTNKVVRKWIGGKYARWKVRCGWLPLHPTCYIKREVMMKCGLYDESYKIAADTNLLVNYLYNCHLKVAYLPEFVTRMRMGGMSTDSAKRKKMWDEDIRVYSGYGFKPVALTKLMKIAWKVPQFIKAKFM